MKKRTKSQTQNYINSVIGDLDDYLQHIVGLDDQSYRRADKIVEWVENWKGYLAQEGRFNSRSIAALKRGSIIFVDLGFNVGREFGGLHYAIVLNKKDSRNNHLLHILPLTSVKDTTNLDKLHKTQFYIGKEVYHLLREKTLSHYQEVKKIHEGYVQKKEDLEAKKQHILELLNEVPKSIGELSKTEETDSNYKELQEHIIKSLEFTRGELEELEKANSQINELIKTLEKKIDYVNKVLSKANNMNKGSIVLLNQITTISKMRLYDPKNNNSVLKDIVLSSETMDKIDEQLKLII